MPETTMIGFILLPLVKTDQKLFVLASLFNSQRSEENVSKEPSMKLKWKHGLLTGETWKLTIW